MHRAAQLEKGHSGDRLVENYKKTILFGGEFGQFQANRLIDTTADTITPNGGFEDLFGNHYGKTLEPAGILGINQRQNWRTDSLSLLIDIAHTTA